MVEYEHEYGGEDWRPQVDEVYLHVKTGNLYAIIGVFVHTETGDVMVGYAQLEGRMRDHGGTGELRKPMHVRPLVGDAGFNTPGRFEKVADHWRRVCRGVGGVGVRWVYRDELLLSKKVRCGKMECPDCRGYGYG